MRTEFGVTVECLRCRHVGVLSRETLARLAITPNTPIASFIKRLRCRKCGSRSVSATRRAPDQKSLLMCGRFTARMTWEELVRFYRLTLDRPPRNTQARYNICPTDPVDTVVSQDGRRHLISMRWGLIANWWNKPHKEMKQATFNARAEIVATKPFFRDAFKDKRCLIPASGYYEWLSTATGKPPYYFTRCDGQPLTFAGLWMNGTNPRPTPGSSPARWSSSSPQIRGRHPRPHAGHSRSQ